jgi:hypothetical protein
MVYLSDNTHATIAQTFPECLGAHFHGKETAGHKSVCSNLKAFQCWRQSTACCAYQWHVPVRIRFLKSNQAQFSFPAPTDAVLHWIDTKKI